MTTKAFLTGSRRYGTPRDDSDVDLVLLTDEETLKVLREEGGEYIDLDMLPLDDYAQIRFGKLNVIALTSRVEFEAWHHVTQQLAARAPVTREEAVEALTAAGL